jgi:CelD/BcsL family acetyltransferase involved in cellulose biosynthesis
MAITGEIVGSPLELAAHEVAWSELLARSEANEPTLTPLWLGTWWRVFGSEGGRRLRVLLVFDAGRLIGIIPLQARRHWYRRGLPFRRLELLGSGEAEADEICSEYLGVIAERGREADVLTELTRALAERRLGTWDEVVFPAMRGESRTAALLVETLGRAGFRTEANVISDCPYISLPGSWDEYLAALSSSHRQFVKRSTASFEAWAGGAPELHEVHTGPELEQASAVLQALHGERWSATGRRGAFASVRFRAFHERIMRALLATGALELSWLSVRGEPVAALYNFFWEGKVYFYQSGRKLDVPDAVRPGIMAHLYAIRRAIEAGRREYDFLGGASQYKRKLATGTRPLLTVRAVRSPGLERLRSALEGTITLVRSARSVNAVVA